MTWNTSKPGGFSVRRSRTVIPEAVVVLALLGVSVLCGCRQSPEDDSLELYPVQSAAPAEAPARAQERAERPVPGPDPGMQAAVRPDPEPAGRVVITPRVAMAGDTLTARVEPHDPGRDAFLNYRWFVNGEEPPGRQRETFTGEFKRGDEISVAVLLAGGAGADTILTDAVRVGNAPPNVEELQSPRFEAGTYRTRIVASDPDGDPLAFSVVKAPPGLAVDQSGEITWVPGEDDFGRHEAAISIRDDAGGEVVYTYAFTVENR